MIKIERKKNPQKQQHYLVAKNNDEGNEYLERIRKTNERKRMRFFLIKNNDESMSRKTTTTKINIYIPYLN